MAESRRSTRIARRLGSANIYGNHVNPSQREVPARRIHILTVAATTTGTPATVASNSSSEVISDPTVPAQGGSCPILRLPPELRLSIYEHVFQDFFTRLTAQLDSPPDYSKIEYLPDIQELLSALHVNHTSRIESIDVCRRIADASFGLVSSRSPLSMFTPGYFYIRTQIASNVTLKKIQARHRKIRKTLQWTRRNIVGS
jgi:hypothetical protein